MGIDGKQKTGVTTFQKCDFVSEDYRVFNTCDVFRGSSGSLSGILENGEIRFHSMVTISSRYLDIYREHLTPDAYTDWNQGLSSAYIYSEIQRVLAGQ